MTVSSLRPLPWPRVPERFTHEAGPGYGRSWEGGAGSKGDVGQALPGGDPGRLRVLGGLCSEQKENHQSWEQKQEAGGAADSGPCAQTPQEPGCRPRGEGRASVLGSLLGQHICALGPSRMTQQTLSVILKPQDCVNSACWLRNASSRGSRLETLMGPGNLHSTGRWGCWSPQVTR